MSYRSSAALLVAAASLPAAGCMPGAWKGLDKLVAVVQPVGQGNARGEVTFTRVEGGVLVQARIRGLTPGKHGFHIHTFGDATDLETGKSAGGHYNPEENPHGLPEVEKRHAGDMGNILANQAGMAEYTRTLGNVTLFGIRNPILGRAVIIHKGPDQGVPPSGNAGPKVGLGVIGIAKQ